MSNNKKYIILGIVTTLILALGFSLAYFAPIIRGEGKKITVKTGSLAIVFTDSIEITEEEITPGWSTSKTFTVENESNQPYYYNINLKDVVNTFVTDDFLQYKITSTNGFNMEDFESITKESFQVLEEGIEIGGLETQEYTIYFRYVDSPDIDQSEDMNKEFSGYLSITEGEAKTLAKVLLKDNPTILERTDFSSVFTENNIGTLYKASGNETEDGSDVYYFAGNALNNWLKFGKDQEDNDLYWRIIRTNEDGSVRLLYVGPDKATTTAFIKIDGAYMSGGSNTTGMYNNTYNNTMYVGYMYGSEGSLASDRGNTTNAPIKTVTDTWYSKTLNVKTDTSGNTYDKYVSRTAIYCNDRSTDAYASSGTMYYGARRRLYDAKSPSYKCGNDASKNLYSTADVADKFSASTSKGGNGKLTYPIAQITADEIVYIGRLYANNSPAWYYFNASNGSAIGNNYWWTMSPSYYTSTYKKPYVFVVGGSANIGRFVDNYVNTGATGIRPVLSLKSCVKVITGNGSSETPYEVSVDSTCATLEN